MIAFCATGGEAAPITASWVGGAGDYEDPPRWSFDPPLPVGTLPSNTATDVFTVLIDGEDLNPSIVSIGTSVRVDRLEIAAGDRVRVDDSALLTLHGTLDRPGSGQIVNDGTLELAGVSTGAELDFDGDLSLSGRGRIVLSDNAANRIGARTNTQALMNGEGHRIEGVGQVEASLISNRGSIAAIGTDPLELSFGTLQNMGTLEAVGSALVLSFGSVGNEGFLRVGPAGSVTLGNVTSTGVIDVRDGILTAFGSVANRSDSVFRVAGIGAEASLGRSFNNRGLLEVVDGARLRAEGLTQGDDLAITRIGSGAILELTFDRADIPGGLLELDGGTMLLDDSFVLLSGAQTRLSGHGRFELGTGTLVVRSDSVLDPGIGDAGHFDVTGNFGFSGRLLADLGGNTPDAYDRLTVTGESSISGGVIEVALRDGFLPTVGDTFDLVEAGQLIVSVPLADLFVLPDFDANLFLVPRIESDATGEHLRLGVLELLEATWTGGPGDYSDPRWSFEGTPGVASPNNDASNLFRVRIDGTADEVSDVSLTTNVAIDALEISTGDSLSILDSTLVMAGAANRLHSGTILNDGQLTLASESGRSELRFETDLRLLGGGRLTLSDDGRNRIGSLSEGLTLVHAAEHRLEGAGSIEAETLTNYGAIVADGDNPLRILADVRNLGTLEIRGAGGLELSSFIDNAGIVRVLQGSRLVARSQGIDAQGSLLVSGLGSEARFESGVSSEGLIELRDGGRLSAGVFRHGFGHPDVRTLIGSGSELATGSEGFAFIRGVLELDNGTLSSSGDGRLSLTELRGNGLISLPGGLLDVQSGSVSPGLGGPGLIRIDGNLRSSGLLSIEIAGTSPDLYDRVEVSESIGSLGTVEISLLNGFAPQRGDRFDLLTSQSIDLIVNPASNFRLPDLGNGLFLVASEQAAPRGERIALAVLESVLATWTGGAGDYADPLGWNFDTAPLGAFFPTQDDSSLFQVRIDGGIPSDVMLGRDIEIDRLEISSGDSLRVSNASLGITGATNRPGSGHIVNDGLLTFGGEGLPAQLVFDTDLTLSGNGTLTLGGPGSRIESTDFDALVNEPGHSIQGSGEIAASTIENHGTIAATRDDVLTLSYSFGRLTNRGTLEAREGGSLNLDDFTNDGLLRAVSGSSLSLGRFTNRGRFELRGGASYVATSLSNWAGARLVISGSGSEARLQRGSFGNSGIAEIQEGGRLTATSLFAYGGRISIRSGGELALENGGTIDAGVIELDGGVLSSGSNLTVSAPSFFPFPESSGGALRGNGVVSLPGQLLEIYGTWSPGLSAAGLLEVDGSLRFSGLLEVELGGTDPLDYDRVLVTETATLLGQPGLQLVEVKLIDDFVPVLGDDFDILSAPMVTTFSSLGSAIELPVLANDLFLVSEIVTDGDLQHLRVRTSELVRAAWTGSDGSYSDVSAWSFDRALTAAFPSNDTAHLFNVRIDNGAGAQVSLAHEVAIDRLEIGAGDTLVLDTGANLEIAFGSNRPESGALWNDGTLEIRDGAALGFAGAPNLAGSGVLELTGDGTASILGRTTSPTLGNEVGHTIRGVGTIDSFFIENRGIIEASRGTLAIGSRIFDNEGVLHARGSEARLEFGQRFSGVFNSGSLILEEGAGLTFGQDGLVSQEGGTLEILDGSQLSVADFRQGPGEGSGNPWTRITHGGVLEVTDSFMMSAGRLELDGGALRAPGGLSILEDSAALPSSLEGLGRIEADVTLGEGAQLSLGLDGFGQLDIDGSLFLSGGLFAEIGGTSSSQFDRLTVSDMLELDAGWFVDVSLADGFVPTLGDRFEIVRAGALSNDASITEHLLLPGLDDELFFVPELEQGPVGTSLRLAILQGIDATWRGGNGSYADAAQWEFGTSPVAANLPDNDSNNLFRVTVDDGAPGAESTLSLTEQVAIDRLEIAHGNALEIGDGAGLRVTSGLSRPDSGTIVNAGRLVLGATSQGAELSGEGDLSILGTGHLELSHSELNRVIAEGSRLLFGEGQRVSGAGVLGGDVLENLGEIHADSLTPLRIEVANLRNEGVVESAGAGGLEVVGAFENQGAFRVRSAAEVTGGLVNSGIVEVVNGGSIDASSDLVNAGLFRVSGTGTAVRSDSPFENRGTLELLDGAQLEVLRFLQNLSEDAFVLIGEGARLSARDGFLAQGTLRLDGGVLEAENGLTLGSFFDVGTTRLEGNGRLNIPRLSTRPGDALAPGLDGAGLIEVSGDLDLGSVIEVELGGREAPEYDRLVAGGSGSLRGSIAASLLGDFSPSVGDRFDVVTSADLSVPNIDALLAPHQLSDDLFFVAEIAEQGTSQVLRLHAAGMIQATWTGGPGAFSDSMRWDFDRSPTSTVFPNNARSDLFSVTIDDDDPTLGSEALLDEDVAIDRLAIGLGDALRVAPGRTLTLAGGESRIGSGLVVNHGALLLNDSALHQTSNLELRGAGVLALDRGRIGDAFNGRLLNQEGHSIQGSGILEVRSIDNAGSITARHLDVLEISGNEFTNSGALGALDGGHLTLSAFARNRGGVEILGGSTAHILNSLINDTGSILVADAGSELVVTQSLKHGHELDVRGNARVDAGEFHQLNGPATFASTRITDSELTSEYVRIEDGVITLDGGLLAGEEINFDAGTLLEGNGRILSTAGNKIRAQGSISPGIGIGIGTLAIEGALDLSGGELLLGIGGRAPGEYDTVSVLGVAELAALVQVELVGLFEPAPGRLVAPELGDRFDLIAANKIVDLGSSFSLPTLEGGLRLEVSIQDVGIGDVLRLLVVPEPNTALLLGLGLCLLAVRRQGHPCNALRG